MATRFKSLRIRGPVSLALTVGSILLALSGVILYVMPHGRIAYWNDFRIWGLGKDPWTSLHLILALLFTILATTHAILNIKPLISYLKRKAIAVLASLGAVGLLALTAIIGVPPASWLASGSESAKSAWDEPSPPMPHFEMQTLQAATAFHGTNVEDAISSFEENGVPGAKPGDTFNDLAERTGKAPAELYGIMGGDPAAWPFTSHFEEDDGRGRGYGRGHERGQGRGQGRRKDRRSR